MSQSTCVAVEKLDGYYYIVETRTTRFVPSLMCREGEDISERFLLSATNPRWYPENEVYRSCILPAFRYSSCDEATKRYETFRAGREVVKVLSTSGSTS